MCFFISGILLTPWYYPFSYWLVWKSLFWPYFFAIIKLWSVGFVHQPLISATYTVAFLGAINICSKRNLRILSHFETSEMTKCQELPGASLPGPLPGPYPTPAVGGSLQHPQTPASLALLLAYLQQTKTRPKYPLSLFVICPPTNNFLKKALFRSRSAVW